MWFMSGEKRKKIKLFNQAWDECEARGSCDSFGGFEYRSIKKHWIKSGYPEPITDFIVKHAN